MGFVSHPARRLLLPMLLALAGVHAAAQPLAVQVGSAQLKEFRHEAEAFNAQDPFANAYRAGHYNGYLYGLLDALQGRRVCFRECVCELDKIVAQYLAEHPEVGERPVAEWLVPLLESRYPCR